MAEQAPTESRTLNTRTDGYLENYPREDPVWQGKVTFSLSYPTVGWIVLTMTCTAFVQGVIIYCSHVRDPLPELIRWLDAVANDQLPAQFWIDEEGLTKTFRAWPINANEFACEIRDGYGDVEGQSVFVYMQANKRQFLSEFLKRWDDFIANQFDPVEWEYGADLRTLDVSNIRAFVQAQL